MWNWLPKLFCNSKDQVENVALQPTAPPAKSPVTWHVLGASVRGSSHERSGLPNQDALASWPPDACAPPLVMAVADGHGSAKSFRSDVGARFAVDTSVDCIRELLADVDGKDLSFVKRFFEEQLPREIERRWKATVAQQLLERPLLATELSAVDDKQGSNARHAVAENPSLAYGTTLLIVVVHEVFVACLQLGDGDILVVDANGDVQRPIADDPRLFANETTSLGGQDSWREFRSQFQALAGRPPELIVVATDGYSNSFRTTAGFNAVGPDLLELLKTEGIRNVRENLPTWLSQASQEGSGDDVTVGMLFRQVSELTGYESKATDTNQVTSNQCIDRAAQ
jgi:serine/threonine protein phosphatase PrpC